MRAENCFATPEKIACARKTAGYLLVEERLGERQPSFDGHDERHAAGAQAEETPEDAAPAQPNVALELRPDPTHQHLDQHAYQRYAVAGDQAPQHETVFLVAAGPGPVQDEQRQQVAEYADRERHRGHDDPGSLRALRNGNGRRR